MINPNLLSDSLAAQVAEEVICTCCAEHVEEHIVDNIIDYTIKELLDNIMPSVSEIKRLALFEKLFKSLVSHEREIRAMIIGIWEEERKIIIANLKKMKKMWLEKDVIDQILYPRKQFEVKIAKESKPLFESLMEERGNEELRKIEAELRKPQKQIDVAFDVQNPNVQSWLNTYTPKFSNSLEAVSTAKLRTQLIEGMKLGEGIPQLTKRINGTYANWNKFRSESIARSEAIRASNQGALESYRQSGVVKSKVWVTHLDDRTCPSCRRLDGKIIALEKNYFNRGDPAERITVGETTQTFNNDYEDISAPPRHTRCRCAIAANFKDMGARPPTPGAPKPTGRVRWKPFKNVEQAERWGKQYGIQGLTIKGKKLTLKEWNIIAREIDKIPDGVLHRIKMNGGTIDLVVDSGITIHPSFAQYKGQTPRGWNSGTWDNVPGAGGSVGNPKTVLVANKTGVGHGSTNIVLHEHAHTIDAVYTKGYKSLSDSTKWQGIWKTNTTKGIIPTPYQATYAEEYWAESFAEYFNTPGHGYLPKNVTTYFDNVFKGVGGG